MQPAIPQEWLDVLKEIQQYFPGAVIAGGALRDLLSGKPIKDVDIFVPLHLDYVGTPDVAYEYIWKLFEGEDIDVDPASAYGRFKPASADRDIYAVFKLKRQIPFDIVLCTPDAARVESFDINICQITHDGNKLYFTGEFATGFLTRTIEVLNVNRTGRNAERVFRLADKYPEYTHPGFNRDDYIPF